MFNFFKKKPTSFSSSFLDNHSLKLKYFFRVAIFDVIQGEVIAYDSLSPKVITFDPWPKIIFLESLGNRTVEEFIIYMANSYKGNIPNDLDKTVIAQIEGLLNLNMIALSDTPVTLIDKYRNPKNQKLN